MNNKSYPILNHNGKLFPSWVIKTFNKYKIPRQENIDEVLINVISNKKN